MKITVPGRTELAGNHTDHQGGHVLAAAVDLLIDGTAEMRNDDQILLESDGFGQIRVDLNRLDRQYSRPGTAEALVRGVTDYLRQEGVSIRGFHGRIHSDIPASPVLIS